MYFSSCICETIGRIGIQKVIYHSFEIVVIPTGQTQNGLPIGIQLVGKRWREMELLSIAQEIDQVVGGFHCPPGY
jgi:Asp-tRNA(Asn)/Glu-tRNA(Gln) amidotransferase A subunit family amidase